MKEIITTDTKVIITDNDVAIAEFDKEEAIKCLTDHFERMKVYQDFKLWESRRNGFGWDYNVKEEIKRGIIG